MSVIDILIKKVEELTRAVNSIRSSSKKIPELPDISGEQIFVAASNGTETGKVLLPQNNNQPIEPKTKWQDINLIPSSTFFLSNDSNSFNFSVDLSNWVSSLPNISGFTGGNPFDGLVGYIRNSSNSQVVLKHNVNDGFITTPLFLSSESDYVLNPNEILYFKYSSVRNRCEITVYDFNSIVPLTPVSEVFILSESDVSQPEIVLKLNNLPNKNDFVNSFCGGVFLNPHSITVVDDYIIINKSTVDYSFKSGMKITVNYKY